MSVSNFGGFPEGGSKTVNFPAVERAEAVVGISLPELSTDAGVEFTSSGLSLVEVAFRNGISDSAPTDDNNDVAIAGGVETKTSRDRDLSVAGVPFEPDEVALPTAAVDALSSLDGLSFEALSLDDGGMGVYVSFLSLPDTSSRDECPCVRLPPPYPGGMP